MANLNFPKELFGQAFFLNTLEEGRQQAEEDRQQAREELQKNQKKLEIEDNIRLLSDPDVTANDEKEALLRISSLQGAPAAKNILAVIERDDKVERAEFARAADKALKLAIFFKGIKDPVKRMQAIKQEIIIAQIAGEDITELVNLAQMPPEEQEIAIEKQRITSTDVKTLTKPKEGFTLSQGQKRFDSAGRPIASVPGVSKPPETRTINVSQGLEQRQEFNPATSKFENVGTPFEKGAKGPIEFAQDIVVAKAKSQADFQQAVAIKQAELELQEQSSSGKQKRQLQSLKIKSLKLKEKLRESKELTARESKQIKAALVENRIDEAVKLVNKWFTTGFLGNLLKMVGGTDARNLEATIETIQANIGFEELKAMKAASPTGGALGQVSERELRLLTATIASLDIGQDDDVLLKNLELIRTHVNNWRQTVTGINPDLINRGAPATTAPQAPVETQGGFTIKRLR